MKSRTSTPSSLRLYQGFTGLNTSKSEVSLEAPDAQAFVAMDNLWCSHKGYLSNERPLRKLGSESAAVPHLRFYAGRRDGVAYAARLAGHIELRVLDKTWIPSPVKWPRTARPTSCIFNRDAYFAPGGELVPQSFNGTAWTEMTAADAKGAAIVCSISNRLALTGYDRNPTEVIVSRVNSSATLASDEADGEGSPLKAFRFNIANLIGTADRITGLAAYESGRLAIFTNDRVLVYVAPIDNSQWDLDERININVGCVSHNTIAAIGDEVFFCSRVGVHTLRRSSLNGSTVFTQPLSVAAEETYRRLVAAVKDPRDISAVFDRDNGRYTVFFPVNENTTYRLTLDVSPKGQESGVTDGLWSVSTFAGLMCGDSFSGFAAFGSVAGLFSLGQEYETDGLRGAGTAETPILWHGDILEPKSSHSLVLYASGVGKVMVFAEDETRRELNTKVFELGADGRADVLGVPLVRQFEQPFQHTYSGLRLRVKIEDGADQVRVFALGVRLRKE